MKGYLLTYNDIDFQIDAELDYDQYDGYLDIILDKAFVGGVDIIELLSERQKEAIMDIMDIMFRRGEIC